MDGNKIIFIAIGVLWGWLFFRFLIWTEIKARKYVRQNLPQVWDDNLPWIYHRSIFDPLNRCEDEGFHALRRERDRGIKYLLASCVVIFILFWCYFAVYKGK